MLKGFFKSFFLLEGSDRIILIEAFCLREKKLLEISLNCIALEIQLLYNILNLLAIYFLKSLSKIILVKHMAVFFVSYILTNKTLVSWIFVFKMQLYASKKVIN